MKDKLNNYAVASYLVEVESGKNLKTIAEHMAIEDTIGGQMILKNMSNLLKKCVGKVHSIKEVSRNKGIVKILYPIINMDYKIAPYPHLWMFLAGGAAFELACYKSLRLLDFELPAQYLKSFLGPKFGINGIKKILNKKESDFLFGTIVKPCCGLTEKQVADFIYQSALGGIDFVKDDEKMNNVSYCRLDKRVKLVHKKLKEVYEKTGKKVIYATNITTNTKNILDNARIALECGANALMLNVFAAGFDAISILRESKEINVPIYCHSGTRSAFAREPNNGIALTVFAKIVRYLGGDFFRTGLMGGYLIGNQEYFDVANEALVEKLPDIKDTVVVLSGGLKATNLGVNLKHNGYNRLYLGGGSIADHPMGPKAGAIAFKQAEEAYRFNIDIKEYARDHKELQIAINRWGITK